MLNHKKKIIAPVIITALIVLYYVVFAIACFTLDIPFIVKLLGGIIPLILAGVCIYVLIERIKEIRSGEEDDLSKY